MHLFCAPVALVAQSCTLLYRRFAIGNATVMTERRGPVEALQDAILRYGRLRICATSHHRPYEAQAPQRNLVESA
jgi:hypothetical protein